MATNTQVSPVAMLRMAMAVSVLLFGLVAWGVHRQARWTPTPFPAAIRLVQVAVAVAAVYAALVTRGQVAAETDPVKRNSLLLRGWAFGEAAALFGGVIFLLTPEWQWYALGLVAMLATFRLLPIPRAA